MPSLKADRTFVDKVIGAFSPVRELRRRSARLLNEHLGMAGGYYRGKRRGRNLGSWITRRGDGNTHIREAIHDLRADSIDLYTNSALAVSAIDTETDNVIGMGLQPQPTIDHKHLNISTEEAAEIEQDILREWRIFTKHCDQTLMCSFDELQTMILRNIALSGDVFINMPYLNRSDKGAIYELTLNVIEAHRVRNEHDVPDTKNLVMGVELDQHGAPENYHVMTRHPDSTTIDNAQREWDMLNVFDADGNRVTLHVFKQLRPGSTRGVPLLAPVLEMFKKLDTLSQAELDAFVINSFFTVFLKNAKATKDGQLPLDVLTNLQRDDDAGELSLGSGNILQLFEDEELEFANPQRSSSDFDKFYRLLVTQIAGAIGMPSEVLLKQFNASYSASRGALLEAWKHFNSVRSWFVGSFNQPVYEEFLFEAVGRGFLNLPGYMTDPRAKAAWSRCTWIGPAQGQLNPLDEAKADEVNLKNNLSSRQIIAARNGQQWETVNEQNAQAGDVMMETGLSTTKVMNPDKEPEKQPEPIPVDPDNN